MNDFERQVSAEFRELMGPVLPVDDAAIFKAITAGHAPKWRFQSMFSATKFVVAGAIVALFGGFLLSGVLTQPRAKELAPAASAVSGTPRLVYMLEGDVYVAEEDGTDPVRIIDGDDESECAGLRDNRGLVSPDGRHIAVRSEWSDDCPGTVSIFDLDGQLVTSVPGAGWDIAWSPDSTRIATWISFGETFGVYGVDGTLQAELDTSPIDLSGDKDPRWTPDGTALLLPTVVDTVGDSYYLTARWPLDGGEPEILPITDPLSIPSISFSPDGTRVASVGPDSQLVVSALEGTAPEWEFYFEPGDKVDGGWARPPLWSPSGDRIAVVTRRWSTDTAGEPIVESTSLWVADPSTGQSTKVDSTRVDTVQGVGYLRAIAFSPDGDRVLVGKIDADGATGLWTMASDGSGSTLLVAGADAGEWVQPLSGRG